MKLIFLRHAKATDREPGLDDEIRRLTAKGRKKAELVAKGLVRFIKDTDSVHVWASPALRSRETATIVALELGGAKIEEYPAIYTGNLEELISKWVQLKEAQTIIVVGHEPYLSLWSRQLTDVSLPFKKCAAAGFELKTSNLVSLTWFASPNTLVQIGKNS